MLYDHNSLQNKQFHTSNAVQQHVEHHPSNFKSPSQQNFSINQSNNKQEFDTSKMNQNNRRPYQGARLAAQQQHINGSNRGHINDLPIRMVINAKYVGAVIGQGGSNIREICHASKAKCVIDITRSIREGNGNLVEKAVNVYGSLNNASGACIKILEIVLRESANDPINHGKNVETELKLLAHNNLIGRLIGKRGSTIKKIMDDTACVIFISNTNEMSRFNVERTITIRGQSLQNLARAQIMVSEKLKSTWDSDMKNPQARAMYSIPMNPLPPISPLMFRTPDFAPITAAYGTAAINPYAMGSPYRPIPVYGQNGPSPRHDSSQLSGQQNNKVGGSMNVTPNGIASPAANAYNSYQMGRFANGPSGRGLEISYVWVPGTAVGALIGTQGSNIRKIMRSSGARIHIDSPKPNTSADNNAGQQNGSMVASKPEPTEQSPNAQMLKQVALANEVAPPNSKQTERRVIIMGTEIQQYKSQFWVFHRLSEDHYIYFDSMRLCIDIPIPGSVIGRIIGKKGHNIKELQRFTGAQVKLIGNKPPEDGQQRPDHVFLRIIGNFNAAQVVQTRVRQVVRSSQTEENNQKRQHEDNVNVVNKESNAEGVVVNTGGTTNDAARTNQPEIKSKIEGQQPPVANHIFATQYQYLHQNGPPTTALNVVYH